MAKVAGGSGLSFVARLDTNRFKKEKAEFEKMLKDLGVCSAKSFDTKPMTEYQQGLLKIKQEALEFAKQKEADRKADRDASLATQKALREERELIKQRNAEIAKKPKTVISDSASEIASYQASRNGAGNGVVNTAFTTYLREVKNDFDQGKISAAEYVAELERYSAVSVQNTNTTKQTITQAKQLVLSKKELAKELAIEKLRQQEATAALKNNAREMLNEKGSLENRRAALIRLTGVFDRLNAVQRATPAGQRLEKIVEGLSKSVGELELKTNRGQRNVGQYTNAFAAGANKAWGALKQVANILPGLGIAGLLAFAIDPITEYISQLDIFKNKARDIEQAHQDVAAAMGQAGSAAGKATIDVALMTQRFQEAKKGLISKKEVLKEYNEGIGKTLGVTNDINVAEERTIRNGQAYVQLMFKKAEAAAYMAVYQDKLAKAAEELAKTDEQSGSYILSGTKGKGLKNTRGEDIFTANALRNREQAAKPFQDQAEVIKKLILSKGKEIDEFAHQNKINVFENSVEVSPKSAETALNAARAFSKKLTDLHNSSFRKQLSTDDAEIQSVRDKYRQFGEEADQYFTKYGGKAVVKLNGKNVSKSQVFGTLKADQQQEEDAILAKRKEEAAKKEREAEQEHYDKLLNDFRDYGQKREKLTRDYENDILLLHNDPRQQDERRKPYLKDLKELDDTNIAKLASYEKMFTGIENLSTRNALKLVQTARTDFARSLKNGLVMTAEQIKEVNALFDKTENSIREKNGQAMKGLASEIQNVASEVSALDEEFGKVLGTVGNVVGKIGEIKGFREAFNKQGATGLDKLTAGLGIFGSGVSIFNSIFSLFDKSAQREVQASYTRDLQNKQTEAINKALERQVALLDQVYGTERIKNYDAAIKQARENEAKYASQLADRYQLTGDAQLDSILSNINNGQGTGVFGLRPEDFIKQNQDKLNALKLPSDLNALQRLLDEGKLDANTATIVQNLIKANETAEQLANNLRAENVGASLDTIVDEFMSSLTDGADNFEDTLTKSIRRGLLNALKGDLTQKYIQDFYSQLDKALADGEISSDEDAELKKLYDAAEEYGKKKLEYIDKVAPDTGTSSNSQNTLKGDVKNLSEDTGTKIVGGVNGLRLVQIETLQAVKSQGGTLGDLYVIARDSFNVALKIERNTRETADNTSSALPLLKSIAENTKGSLDAQLRAAGKYGY